MLDAQLPGWRDEPEVVREQQKAWQQMLGRLQRFVGEQQRLPRRKEVAEGAAVGAWLDTQKVLHRNQQLAPDRKCAGRSRAWLECAAAPCTQAVRPV